VNKIMKFGSWLILIIALGLIATASQIELKTSGGASFPGSVNSSSYMKATNFTCTNCISLTQVKDIYLQYIGGTMTGNIKMGDNDITGVKDLNATETYTALMATGNAKLNEYDIYNATYINASQANFGPTTNLASFARASSTVGTNWIYRDLASGSTAGPVLFIENDAATDDQPALLVQQDAPAPAISLIGVGYLNIKMGEGDIYNATDINTTHVHATTLYGAWAPTANIVMGDKGINNASWVNSTGMKVVNLYPTKIMNNVNHTQKNMTDVECIIFQSTGKLCTGV
jgi:hypothetical protein